MSASSLFVEGGQAKIDMRYISPASGPLNMGGFEIEGAAQIEGTIIRAEQIGLPAGSLENAVDFIDPIRTDYTITSDPPAGAGSAQLNGNAAEIVVGAKVASDPVVRFKKETFSDATITNTGATFTFNPPLTDSDFQTLSLVGNDLSISGGNTVDLSGMPVITALQVKTQNITAVAGVTDVSGNVVVSGDAIIKGVAPSLDFYDSSNIQKASLDYAELNDKITMVGANVTLDTTSAGYPRVILEGTGLTVRTDDLPVKLERYDATGTTVDTSIALNVLGEAKLSSATGSASLRVEASGGKGGDITANETLGDFVIEGKNGLATTIKSTGSSSTATITLYEDGFTAQQTIVMSASATNKLIQTATETQIVGDYGLAAPARFVITDPTAGVQSSIELYGNQNALQQTGEFYEVFGGANAITRIVADSLNGESAVSAEGGDLNLRAVTGTVKMGDTLGVGSSTTVKVEDSIQTITLTAGTDLVLDGAGLQSGTSSGNSGQHLRIKLNGTYYKIALEND